MKNRKVLVVSFILVACLTIGVGFAALTGSLRADGIVHINLDDSNLKVQYTDADDEEATLNGTAIVKGTDYTVEYASNNTVATVTINNNVMKALNDTVTVKLPIANYSDGVDAIVKKPTVTMQGNATTFLTVEGVKAQLNGTDVESVTLECADDDNGNTEGTAFLLITIKLNAVPTESNVTCNFSVAIATSSVSQ